MRPILTLDFETDPFKHGRIVKPFAAGLYDGQNFASIWSKNCVAKIIAHIKTLFPSIIYIHNGGRFDLHLGLIPYLNPEMKIINGRIVEATLDCAGGSHLIRDSYSILPIPLKAYKKDDIDINKMEAHCRELHRDEIMLYLRGDCVYLHELVSAFRAEFGEYLTIGSAAMAQLKSFHPFDSGTQYLDSKFRSQFFFGGRVQCFAKGIINRNVSIYDVNSMYPKVMRDSLHPIGNGFSVGKYVGPKTAFILCEGRQCGSYGAFPIRDKVGINFTTERGQFAVSIHEWQAAEQTRSFKCDRVLKVYDFDDWMSFDGFVDHFFSSKVSAKLSGDRLHELFYKLILNSAYGKFAQNPDNFADYRIEPFGNRLPAPWILATIPQRFESAADYNVWKRPVTRHSYYNVACGASITGAARATLLRGLYDAEKPVYCDTDSIVCESLAAPIDDKALGAWKLEARGNRVAIAGKKLYAVWSNGKLVKKATKGARISDAEILAVAGGAKVTYKKEAPTFKLHGGVDWITREIRMTA